MGLVIVVGVLLAVAGFTHARHRRAVRDCARYGHWWETDYAGLVCVRCERRIGP